MSRNMGQNRDKAGMINPSSPRHKSKRASDARAQKGCNPKHPTHGWPRRALARGKSGNKGKNRRGNCRAAFSEYPSACGPYGC